MPKRQINGRDNSQSPSHVRELSWAEFDREVQRLAREILRTYKPNAVVGVAHGGVFVGGAIASALSCDFYPVRISRRSRDKIVRRSPKISGKMPNVLSGKRVLLVDDVASSGDTLELARGLLKKVGAKLVKTACLVCKEEGYHPDWESWQSDELFVFPWDYEPVAEDDRF